MKDHEYGTRQTKIFKALEDARNKLEQVDRQREGVLMEIGEIMRAAREHNEQLPEHRQVDRVDITQAAAYVRLSRPTLYRLMRTTTEDDGPDASAYSGHRLAELYATMGLDYPDVAAEFLARYPQVATIEYVMSVYYDLWLEDHPDQEDLEYRRVPGVKYLREIRGRVLGAIQAGPLPENDAPAAA